MEIKVAYNNIIYDGFSHKNLDDKTLSKFKNDVNIILTSKNKSPSVVSLLTICSVLEINVPKFNTKDVKIREKIYQFLIPHHKRIRDWYNIENKPNTPKMTLISKKIIEQFLISKNELLEVKEEKLLASLTEQIKLSEYEIEGKLVKVFIDRFLITHEEYTYREVMNCIKKMSTDNIVRLSFDKKRFGIIKQEKDPSYNVVIEDDLYNDIFHNNKLALFKCLTFKQAVNVLINNCVNLSELPDDEKIIVAKHLIINFIEDGLLV